MSSITQPGAAEFTSAQKAGQFGTQSDGFNDLDTTNFLKLLINELQNQDPLNPMDNSEMIEQIGQIRGIGATDRLSSTLTDLNNNNQLVTASGLIGKTITGLADDSTDTTGTVERVTVETDTENETRSVKVHVGGKTMDVNNIREIETG